MAKNSSVDQSSLSIIGGIYRHRKITFTDTDDLRPTGARIRETLFNWLQPYLFDATCLDLFAGSGVLGFEALSRGAQSVVFVEKNRRAAQQLEHTIKNLKITQAVVKNDDFRTGLTDSADVIFLDPPYSLRLLPELLDIIKPCSPQIIFIEDEQPFEQWVNERGDYEIIKSKKAGNIYYGLLRPTVK